MKSPIALHFIAASLGDQSMTFALSQVNALLTKAAYVGAPSYEIKEQGMVGSRTLALFCHPPAALAMESQRESEGMAFADDARYCEECHAFGAHEDCPHSEIDP